MTELYVEPAPTCETCFAACCQDLRLVLAPENVDLLEEAGTDLTELLPADKSGGAPEDLRDWSKASEELQRLAEATHDDDLKATYALLANVSLGMKPGEGYYGITGRCGNLTDDNRCAVFGDPRRPAACPDLLTGSAKCLDLRLAFILKSGFDA